MPCIIVFAINTRVVLGTDGGSSASTRDTSTLYVSFHAEPEAQCSLRALERN